MSWSFRNLLRPRTTGVHPVLGVLETEIMSRLWDRGSEASVRDVQRTLSSLAYTTVMTTLDRLYKKGLLTRRKVGRAFVYQPAVGREEFHGQMAGGMLNRLLEGSGQRRPVLSALVRTIGAEDPPLLDELERLVREERKRRRHS
jgi:predicted transcriptional regulator